MYKLYGKWLHAIINAESSYILIKAEEEIRALLTIAQLVCRLSKVCRINCRYYVFSSGMSGRLH